MEKKEFRNVISSLPWNLVAQRAKVSCMTVNRWKRGESFPSGEKMLSLFPLLEKTMAEKKEREAENGK